MTYIVALKLVAARISTFSASISNGGGLPDSSFFPLDGQGLAMRTKHNFSFTTEFTLHSRTMRRNITFKGDDDVWSSSISNSSLIWWAPCAETGSIALDTLG